MVIVAAIQRWQRWKKCDHTAGPTPEVPQRCAGLGCQCGAIFGLRSLGPLWRKGSLGLDRASKRHSALSMRNISLLRPATEATKIRDSAYRARNRAAQIQPGLRC